MVARIGPNVLLQPGISPSKKTILTNCCIRSTLSIYPIKMVIEGGHDGHFFDAAPIPGLKSEDQQGQDPELAYLLSDQYIWDQLEDFYLELKEFRRDKKNSRNKGILRSKDTDKDIVRRSWIGGVSMIFQSDVIRSFLEPHEELLREVDNYLETHTPNAINKRENGAILEDGTTEKGHTEFDDAFDALGLMIDIRFLRQPTQLAPAA